jgi:hypothetical protein
MWLFIGTCLIVGGLYLCGVIANAITGVDDGPVEQMAEFLIKEKTGHEIDISPERSKDRK